ncbi:MAG: class I SAM-dependent methyltransferase [Chloroflexi bacterium]|nr:class I SAM-dependent methyltransferase [Chloroflexota bacterium]
MSRLGQIKAFIRTKCPACALVVGQIRGLHYKTQRLPHKWKSMKSVFSEIYYNNRWGSQETVSGLASELSQTSVIRQEIPILIKEKNARSLLDASCGDFHWMKEIELDLDRYIGVDIVPDLVVQNQQKYGSETREFIALDIARDNLPQVDIILCRDCLVHFSFEHIISATRNFRRSKSKYLLTTTFPELSKNEDITTGGWRPINLQLPPFNFPKPIKLIDEGFTRPDGAAYSDKSLGLWKLEDILL